MTWPTKTDFVDGDVLTAAQVNNIGTNLNLADPTSATIGQVLTANGAGSMSFQDAGGGGLTQIATTSLTSGSSYTFSSIPQTYKHLLLQARNVTCSGTMTHYGITYKTSTATNKAGRYDANISTASAMTTTGMEAYYALGPVNIPSYPVNATGYNNEFFWQIWDYANTTNYWKMTTMWSTYQPTTTSYRVVGTGFGLQSETTNIDQIVFRIANSTVASTATFTAGTLTLYGVQ